VCVRLSGSVGRAVTLESHDLECSCVVTIFGTASVEYQNTEVVLLITRYYNVIMILLVVDVRVFVRQSRHFAVSLIIDEIKKLSCDVCCFYCTGSRWHKIAPPELIALDCDNLLLLYSKYFGHNCGSYFYFLCIGSDGSSWYKRRKG